MMQAVALGGISDLQEGREIIRNSFSVERYQPQNTRVWDIAYEKLQKNNKGKLILSVNWKDQ